MKSQDERHDFWRRVAQEMARDMGHFSEEDQTFRVERFNIVTTIKVTATSVEVLHAVTNPVSRPRVDVGQIRLTRDRFSSARDAIVSQDFGAVAECSFDSRVRTVHSVA